jgi:hypothetical protein
MDWAALPVIVSDGGSTWLAAWDSDKALGGQPRLDVGRDIYLCRSTDSGASWSAPSILNSDSGSLPLLSNTAPALATDGAGNWVCVWQAWGDSPDFRSDIRMARSTDGGATWGAPTCVSRIESPDPGYNSSAAVASGGADKWVIVWNSQDTLDGALPQGDNIFFARSTDGATTFSAPAVLNADAAAGAYNQTPQIAFASGLFTTVRSRVQASRQLRVA